MTISLILLSITWTLIAFLQIMDLTSKWRQKRWEERWAKRRAKRDAEWNAFMEMVRGREDPEPECNCYCVGDQADASDCELHRR